MQEDFARQLAMLGDESSEMFLLGKYFHPQRYLFLLAGGALVQGKGGTGDTFNAGFLSENITD